MQQISDMDPRDPSILSNLFKSTYVRTSINEMRENVAEADDKAVKSSDFLKTRIIEMASFFESNFNQVGLTKYVSEVSGYIYRLMMNTPELEKYAYLCYRSLDEKYRNTKTQSYTKHLEKIERDKVEAALEALKAVDYSKLPSDYLRKVNVELVDNEDRLQREVVQERKEVFEAPEVLNDLAYNSDNEKYKFEKAEMGKPIATVEEMTKDTEYKECLDMIRTTIDKIIEAYGKIKINFTETYIPLSLETAKKALRHFELQLEYIRPYYDKKYRLDHWQMLKASIVKHDKSSAAAAKSTAVQCLHIVDRNGKPVFRNMTKEQLEAVDVWQFNFFINWVNSHIETPDLITAIYKEHYQRAISDRQVKLNKTLQHFA